MAPTLPVIAGKPAPTGISSSNACDIPPHCPYVFGLINGAIALDLAESTKGFDILRRDRRVIGANPWKTRLALGHEDHQAWVVTAPQQLTLD
ncbi:hypothetical protein [Pseudomonas xanthosomatis]|uniref:hypothetical protein n=1 Tax=Pseudomonas xanthosomatis TaxID=2842356 RepID=UPI003511FCCC